MVQIHNKVYVQDMQDFGINNQNQKEENKTEERKGKKREKSKLNYYFIYYPLKFRNQEYVLNTMHKMWG